MAGLDLDTWAPGAISFGPPRESLGVLERLKAIGLFWPETTAGDVFPIEEFARAAVREANLVAAALRGDFVPDDLDAVDHGFSANLGDATA